MSEIEFTIVVVIAVGDLYIRKAEVGHVRHQLIADTRQASIYPAVVVTVVGAFVLLLFSFVVPKFASLLTSAKVPLPLITQIVFGVSDFAKATWWMWFVAFIGGFVGVKIARRTSKDPLHVKKAISRQSE